MTVEYMFYCTYNINDKKIYVYKFDISEQTPYKLSSVWLWRR